VFSNNLDESSELRGKLYLQVGNKEEVEYLTTRFRNKLFITCDDYYIPFKDKSLERALYNSLIRDSRDWAVLLQQKGYFNEEIAGNVEDYHDHKFWSPLWGENESW